MVVPRSTCRCAVEENGRPDGRPDGRTSSPPAAPASDRGAVGAGGCCRRSWWSVAVSCSVARLLADCCEAAMGATPGGSWAAVAVVRRGGYVLLCVACGLSSVRHTIKGQQTWARRMFVCLSICLSLTAPSRCCPPPPPSPLCCTRRAAARPPPAAAAPPRPPRRRARPRA